MTDKEVRAIAIKEVTYADMIAIGATEEIATAASWKARCALKHLGIVQLTRLETGLSKKPRLLLKISVKQ